jgi:hypothetical protein
MIEILWKFSKKSCTIMFAFSHIIYYAGPAFRALPLVVNSITFIYFIVGVYVSVSYTMSICVLVFH